MTFTNTCEICTGEPQGSGENIGTNSTREGTYWVNGDQLCVELSNGSITDSTVDLAVMDLSGSKVYSSVSGIQVAPQQTAYQCFSGFGLQDDGVSPVNQCRLSITVSGHEIGLKVF